MTVRLSLVLAFLSIAIGATQAQEPTTAGERPAIRPLPELFPRLAGVSKIDPNEIRASPRWNKDEESPPVTARRAILLATQEIQRFDKTIEYDRTANRWRFHSLELMPPYRHGNWYWLAKFDFDSIPHSINMLAGIPEQVHVPVLMNGKTLELQLPDPVDDMAPNDMREMHGDSSEVSTSTQSVR